MNAPANAQQTGDTAHMQRLGAAAAAELRKTVRVALTDVMSHFVQHLPKGIAEAAGRASNPTDSNALMELSKGIPSRANAWIETFAKQVDQHLIGGLARARAAESRAPARAAD